jgi:hypothetical protein
VRLSSVALRFSGVSHVLDLPPAPPPKLRILLLTCYTTHAAREYYDRVVLRLFKHYHTAVQFAGGLLLSGCVRAC